MQGDGESSGVTDSGHQGSLSRDDGRTGASAIVFLGPSVDRACAKKLLPDGTFLHPICQGQLISAVALHHPEVVAIVDGEFGQTLSVWHKEILHVLGQGVRVFGSSSMGALRAAECGIYGMEGVGRIYEWYRDGILTDDDEVALLHSEADTGWRSLTWPMVNVRVTVERLLAEGQLDGEGARQIQETAKSLYFGSRTESTLASALISSGRSDGVALAGLVSSHYVDQKRLDAVELLRRLDTDLGERPTELREPRERSGGLARAMRSCDTEVERSTGRVLRYQIIDDVALHEPDFEQLQERALHRAIAVSYAEDFGFEPTSEELNEERSRFLLRMGLTEETLPAWLEGNDLDETDLEELIVDEAKTHRLRRWYLALQGYERNRRVVADQLRLERRYPGVADRAARRAALSATPGPDVLPDEKDIPGMLSEHVAATGLRPSQPFPEWLDEHGFASGAEFLLAVSDAAHARREGARLQDRVEKALGWIMEIKRD